MNTKLTLRFDQRLIRRAKAHARRSGKSVSEIVADYFSLLGGQPQTDDQELTPTVRAGRGAATLGLLKIAPVNRGILGVVRSDERSDRRRLAQRHMCPLSGLPAVQ